jgi:hypothetical protein
MTASTPNELITGFPHISLLKVTGEPTFRDLKITRRYIKTNAMSVSSYEGGGRHRHLCLIMTNEEYFALSTDVITAPENPGATPVITNNATSAQITEANRAHKEATRVYHTYNNVDQAFKKLIIDAFEDQFLNALLDEVFGYANRTSLDLLTHLLTYYAMIAPMEFTQNYERLNTPYDTNQLIEYFFQQIQDLELLRSPADNPTGTQLLLMLHTLLFLTLACFLMLVMHGKCALQCKRPGSTSRFTSWQHIDNFV